MKKILFLVTKSINGGAQKWTKEQMEICSDEFECYLGTDNKGWIVDNTNAKNIFLNELIHRRFSISYFIALKTFIKVNQIDMIIASSANAGIYARLIKLLDKNIKVVYVSHGWSSIYNGGKLKFLYLFIEKQLSKISDFILCISEKDYYEAKNTLKIEARKLKLLTNKINPMTIKHRAKNDKVKILTVARLTPPKRVDLLINAVKNIDTDIELHIIGDGLLHENLESISDEKIIFHGEVNSFDDFSKYDIFVLISDSEGLPLSALEAMSCGLPLILSDVGSCASLISNNGCLVENNLLEIEEAILLCIENKEIFSKKSKLLFDTKFNLQKNKYQYLDQYKELLL